MANTWYSSMRDCRAICMWQSLRARAGWDHHDDSRLRDETICPRHGLTTGKRSSLIPTAMWNWDIFRQRLLERNAADFVVGPGEQTGPRLSSDASWVLYWDYATQGAGASASMRLLRVPVSLS